MNQIELKMVQKEAIMKSITIHDIDDSLDALIRKKAKEEGRSLNKTIKHLLKKSLGLNPESDKNHREEFLEFCGLWSKNDENDFNRRIKDLSEINPEEWR